MRGEVSERCNLLIQIKNLAAKWATFAADSEKGESALVVSA